MRKRRRGKRVPSPGPSPPHPPTLASWRRFRNPPPRARAGLARLAPLSAERAGARGAPAGLVHHSRAEQWADAVAGAGAGVPPPPRRLGSAPAGAGQAAGVSGRRSPGWLGEAAPCRAPNFRARQTSPSASRGDARRVGEKSTEAAAAPSLAPAPGFPTSLALEPEGGRGARAQHPGVSSDTPISTQSRVVEVLQRCIGSPRCCRDMAWVGEAQG